MVFTLTQLFMSLRNLLLSLHRSLTLDGFLKFPGWEFYQGAHILLRLDKESELAVRGDLRKTWLSRRHVRLGQASPAIAEQLSEMATRWNFFCSMCVMHRSSVWRRKNDLWYHVIISLKPNHLLVCCRKIWNIVTEFCLMVNASRCAILRSCADSCRIKKI